LVIIGQKTGELFEAAADRRVERTQGFFVVAGRSHSSRENHFTEAAAVSQEPEGNHWVWEPSKRLQELASLVDSLLRVLVAESGVPDRPTQQLEVAVPNNLEVVWEKRHVDSGVHPGRKDELAFVLKLRRSSAEGKADSVGFRTHGRDGVGDRLRATC
jgi:hypothetical protein